MSDSTCILKKENTSSENNFVISCKATTKLLRMVVGNIKV